MRWDEKRKEEMMFRKVLLNLRKSDLYKELELYNLTNVTGLNLLEQ